mgnify:CR=1 FL=1
MTVGAAPGKDARTGRIRSLADYRDQMREVVKQGLVDIMLMSASTAEVLAQAGLRVVERDVLDPGVRLDVWR